ncbi:hypothetical protein DA01_02815 [Dehalococcoides mccartyi]|uniref:Uncharacterized protein n=1 Tax=Dehalococcoides mccartyi TaxID=61435 RepID=A0A0V8M436_9CHLR|nr:hypothetical protein DA01_02815 [Dehalococcoides mccartyi]
MTRIPGCKNTVQNLKARRAGTMPVVREEPKIFGIFHRIFSLKTAWFTGFSQPKNIFEKIYS